MILKGGKLKQGEKAAIKFAMSIQTVKKSLPPILSLLALLLLVSYIYHNSDRFVPLWNMSGSRLALMIVFALVTLIMNGLVNYVLYQAVDIPVTANESVGLAAVNTLANQLPFMGGIIAKGVYLKRRHGASYGRYVSATVAMFVFF